MTGAEILEEVVVPEGTLLQVEEGVIDEMTPQSYEVQREIHPYDWFALSANGAVVSHNRRYSLLVKSLHDRGRPKVDIKEPVKYGN